MLTVHSKLVQQPHQLGAALHHHRPNTTHRRNPSAPTLSVQPTNVPAQVAKAVREPRQPKQQQQQQPARSTTAAAMVSSSKSSAPAKSDTAATKAVDPSTQSLQPALLTPPATPAPASQQPGRKSPPTAAKPGNGKRSTSQTAQSRRNKEHQSDPVAADARSTTPPPKSPEAAKDAHTSPRKRPTHQRNNTAPTSPVVPTAAAAVATPAPTATGKAPRRRSRKSGAASASGGASSEDEQPSQVIKIAASKKDHSAKQLLSRSAPQATKIARGGVAIADWDTPLTIDIKSVPAGFASGPSTAPLDAAPRFPFGDAYSPPTSPTPNKHIRSPSVPMNGAMFDMEDDFHMPLVTKSAGSSPSVPSARRFKIARSVMPLTGSVTMPALAMLGINSAANMSAPGDLDHPASSSSMDPRFRWASSSFQTGPATRGLPAPGL
ncbi:hypothetical protein BKA62DRAFT_811380 [Auriculariales sp. MPI-PUGE-AT-0066]|nr:hypothetical protein BKA62DRAFT_811380 [Auriculariales sp. MPI-PUGE-AT-0066]